MDGGACSTSRSHPQWLVWAGLWPVRAPHVCLTVASFSLMRAAGSWLARCLAVVAPCSVEGHGRGLPSGARIPAGRVPHLQGSRPRQLEPSCLLRLKGVHFTFGLHHLELVFEDEEQGAWCKVGVWFSFSFTPRNDVCCSFFVLGFFG